MPASKFMIGLVCLCLFSSPLMADEISDRLAEISKNLNALKQNNYQTPSSENEVKLAPRPVHLTQPKKKLMAKAKVEPTEDIGSLIRAPDLLTQEFVTLFTLDDTVYNYLISNTITNNFHLDAPHYSRGKMINIVSYAPSNSEVWCVINEQKVSLQPIEYVKQDKSVIFAGFFRQKDDNEFRTYQYSACFIKQNDKIYRNMVLLNN